MDTVTLLGRVSARSVRNVQTGCLIWPGAIDGAGYPSAGLEGRTVNLHRFVLAMWTGYVGNVARHLCHEKRCLEVTHLAWGSQRDNVRDSQEAGRLACGERNARARLDASDVREMRRMDAQGYKRGTIARLFKVSPSTVSGVLNGHLWKHLSDAA